MDLDDDPDLQASFAEALGSILEEFRDNWQRIYEELEKLRELDEDQISHIVNLTQQTFNIVERELKLTGFWESIPARNKLKAELQSTLLQPEFKELPGIVQNRLCLISRIMEIAEKNNDTILYAE